MRTRGLFLSLLLTIGTTSCDVPLAGSAGGPRGGHEYRIRKGETLFSIAERVYGNGLEWPRLHEANPWVDPDHLRVGDILYLPRLEPPLEPTPERLAGAEESPGSRWGAADPGNGTRRRSWTLPPIFGGTLFGVPVHKLGFLLAACFLLHGLFQGFCIWITANITFVRDASIKKALKATFLTELMTFCTMGLIGVVGLVMVYVSTSTPGDIRAEQLLVTVEEYLRHPAGVGAAAFFLVFLYTILSLRFIPQFFDIRMARAGTVVFLAVLLPHLAGLYLLGQRFGFIV